MSIFDNLLGAFFISFGGLWHRADIGHVGIQRMVLRKLTSHPTSYYANPTKETKLFLITHAYASCFLTSNKTYHTHTDMHTHIHTKMHASGPRSFSPIQIRDFHVLPHEDPESVTTQESNPSEAAPNGKKTDLLKPPGNYLAVMHASSRASCPQIHEVRPRAPPPKASPRDITPSILPEPKQSTHVISNGPLLRPTVLDPHTTDPDLRFTTPSHLGSPSHPPTTLCTCKPHFPTTNTWRWRTSSNYGVGYP